MRNNVRKSNVSIIRVSSPKPYRDYNAKAQHGRYGDPVSYAGRMIDGTWYSIRIVFARNRISFRFLLQNLKVSFFFLRRFKVEDVNPEGVEPSIRMPFIDGSRYCCQYHRCNEP